MRGKAVLVSFNFFGDWFSVSLFSLESCALFASRERLVAHPRASVHTRSYRRTRKREHSEGPPSRTKLGRDFPESATVVASVHLPAPPSIEFLSPLFSALEKPPMAFAAAPAGLALAAAAGWARHMKARRSAEEATKGEKDRASSPPPPSRSGSSGLFQSAAGRAIALYASNGDLLTVVAPPPPPPGALPGGLLALGLP